MKHPLHEEALWAANQTRKGRSPEESALLFVSWNALDAQLDAQKQQAQLAESDARNVSRWLASADDDPDDALHASAHHSAIPVP